MSLRSKKEALAKMDPTIHNNSNQENGENQHSEEKTTGRISYKELSEELRLKLKKPTKALNKQKWLMNFTNDKMITC